MSPALRPPEPPARGVMRYCSSARRRLNDGGEVVLLPIHLFHLFTDPGVVSGFIVPYLDGVTSPTAALDKDGDSVGSCEMGHVQERDEKPRARNMLN